MQQRPTGITLLAVIYLVLAVVSVIWSLLIFGVGGLSWLTGALFSAEDLRAFGGGNTWSGIIGVISAMVQLIVAFGLLGMRRWAWLLAVLGALLTFVQGLIGMFGGGLFVFCCGAFGLLIPGGILFYLMRPHVRAAFGR
ncbi:hypothetical protein [Caldilinea sp.]|uniref:hypothetical protein n=1 Tax=Caldilinea sp. TaxID=2293560 RepID=UPI002BEAB1E3|nr:hypothetical protein [Anaerolineales bacterium]HQY94301.1 hypothetical protein [Caldilinea sp.]HRA65895.1 hypothetical protein [Caldilinea sp.]